MTAARLWDGVAAELVAELRDATFVVGDVEDIAAAQALDVRATLAAPTATAIGYIASTLSGNVVVVGRANPRLFVEIAAELPTVAVYVLPSVESLALAINYRHGDAYSEPERERRLATWLSICASHVQAVNVEGVVAESIEPSRPAATTIVRRAGR